MSKFRPALIVFIASTACLAAGFSITPFWDEDEPRFAAIAETMLTTGDWVVPRYNGTLAVDKPPLMHWSMAACFTCLGTSEFAARLPSAIATLLTAHALLHFGSLWFGATTGILAALAYVGCLLVGVESHAATPDAILTALCTWATLLAAEAILPKGVAGGPNRIGISRAAGVGGLLGLAVLCKGPIGWVGPMAVLMPWAWWLSMSERLARHDRSERSIRSIAADVLSSTARSMWTTRLPLITAVTLAVACPWYVLVGVRTDGAWPAGFFLIHNFGRAAAAMENHSGGFWYHPVTMLVGFFPWSCFLPLSIATTAWRVFRGGGSARRTQVEGLLLLWIVVWLAGFSLAATKLPNYILPAYPAAALLVAACAVDAASKARWPHPRWLATGLGCLAFGGVATSATIIATIFFGLDHAAPAAVIGLVPMAGAAACLWYARRDPQAALRTIAITGLAYTALMVGPVGAWLAKGNTLPALVQRAHRHAGGRARIGTFTQNTPNIVYYAHGNVMEWREEDAADAAKFLESGNDALLLLPENQLALLAAHASNDIRVIGRQRPLFKDEDWLLVGSRGIDHDRDVDGQVARVR